MPVRVRRRIVPGARGLEPTGAIQYEPTERDGRVSVNSGGSWPVSDDFRCPNISFVTSARPDRRRAMFRVRKALAEIVHDTAALEGNPMTFPEVQTLLDGITVGGHRVADAEQVLNQAASWERLLRLVSEGRFKPDRETACGLQGIVARGEALEWGRFRTGAVSIAGTEFEPPPAHELASAFRTGMRNIGRVPVNSPGPCARTSSWPGSNSSGTATSAPDA